MSSDSVPKIVIRRARIAERPVVRRLLELYLFDLSRIDGRGVDRRARYGYPYLNAYWRERGRFPYVMRVDGKWAGFALVNRWSPLEGADWSVAEFFILPPYRQRGFGDVLARWIFAHHKGTWHVAELRANREGTAFWRKVIGRFTRGRYDEKSIRTEEWDGPIQIFVSN